MARRRHRLMYWPIPTWRWVTVPAIGAVTIASGFICCAFRFRAPDLLVALAEDAQAIAHRGERDPGAAQAALGVGEIGLAPQPIGGRPAFRLLGLAQALLGGLGQLERVAPHRDWRQP